MNSDRRTLLKKGITSIVFTSLFSSTITTAAFKQNRLSATHKLLLDELSVIYYAWRNKFEQEPDDFLAVSELANPDLPQLTSELTRIEFHEDQTIVINGLMLGKTEAALLATLYLHN